MREDVGGGAGGKHCSSARALSRFFFVLGQTALQSLVHIEVTASQVRKQRMAAEKQAAEASAQRMLAGNIGGPSAPYHHRVALLDSRGAQSRSCMTVCPGWSRSCACLKLAWQWNTTCYCERWEIGGLKRRRGAAAIIFFKADFFSLSHACSVL